ncbi:hypothetical protein COOONC_08252 [Cooperia oncophora]
MSMKEMRSLDSALKITCPSTRPGLTSMSLAMTTHQSGRRLFTEQKLGWRASFDAYLQTKSIEPSKIWTQIHKIIAEVFRNQQPRMLAALKTMSSEASFFELSRFDFIVDEQLNVFLMEST